MGQSLGTGVVLVGARTRDRQRWVLAGMQCSLQTQVMEEVGEPRGTWRALAGDGGTQHPHSQCPNSTKESSFPGNPTQPFWLPQSHREPSGGGPVIEIL